MKKTILFLAVLLFVARTGSSQITFIKQYSTPSSINYAVNVTDDIAGGYLFNGVSYDTITGLNSFFISKCDLLGNIVWSKHYDSLLIFTGMKRFVNGDLLVFGDKDIFRTSNTGNVIWAKKISGVLAVTDVAMTNDDGLAISCVGGTPGFFSMQIIKMDFAGNVSWSVSTPSTFPSMGSAKIIQTSDGGYLAGINTYESSTGDQVFLVKADSSGTMVWSNSFHTILLETLQQTSDDGFILVGSSAGKASLKKIDLSGNAVWYRTYGSLSQIRFSDVIELANGSLVLAGSVSDSVNNGFLFLAADENGLLTEVFAHNSVYSSFSGNLLKTADGGFLSVWNESSGPLVGNPFNIVQLIKSDSLYSTACNSHPVNYPVDSVQENHHAGTYLVSDTYSAGTKTINEFNFNMNTYVVCKSIDVEKIPLNDRIEIYPNPVKDKLIVESSVAEPLEFFICNILGEIVQRGSTKAGGMFEVDCSFLKAGSYFLNVRDKDSTAAFNFIKN